MMNGNSLRYEKKWPEGHFLLWKSSLSATLKPGFALYGGVPSAHADF